MASRLGFLPNVVKLMSLSPAVLNGFVGLQTALGGQLDRPTREADRPRRLGGERLLLLPGRAQLHRLGQPHARR